MNKNRIRLTESQLRQIVKESVDSILKEGSKKKDPTSQWFKDFNKASKYRETMDYVNKGGRNPNQRNKNVAKTTNKITNESIKTPQAKRKLEDALRNVMGILSSYIEEDFEIFKKAELDNLYNICSDLTKKINNSYDYGPYEGEPYYFGY